MDAIKIEQAKLDYQKIVSFIEDGSPIPPETDPYWEACAALDRLGGFIAEIECAKNTEQQVQPDNGGMCTRPDVFDCHAKVGTGGRCMNIVPCPPLQVN